MTFDGLRDDEGKMGGRVEDAEMRTRKISGIGERSTIEINDQRESH